MKKMFLVLSSLLALSLTANAQVLDSEQMKNTLWAGVGAPLDGDPNIYGFTDTFQARFDRGKLTVEGMLNWSLLANYDNNCDVDNFVLGTSNLNPLIIKYGVNDFSNGYWAGKSKLSNDAAVYAATYGVALDDRPNVSNALQDSYYVNVFYHVTENIDIGAGTKLNWSVGPAPGYGNWLWEDDAHVRQGGFSTTYDDRSGVYSQTSSESVHSYRYYVDAPGTADVVGFVPYANKYAKRAIGVRFQTSDEMLQLGGALPNGFNTDDFVSNFGVRFAPVKWLALAAAIEGAFEDGSNFYTGATIGADYFILDLYAAADSLFTDADDDEAYGIGAAVTFTIPRTEFLLRPEIGVNLFENDNYTFAWYTGATLSFDVTDKIGFKVWGSLAFGSKDKRWDDYDVSDDWDGGHVIDVRPQLTFNYSKQTSFSAYIDFENRKAFDDITRNCWASGLFITHTF